MIRVRLVLLFALLSGAAYALHAQEAVTLSTPIVKTASGCSLDTLLLDVTRNRIVATLVCPGGDPISKQYDSFTTPTGATLLHTLNISNFSGATSMIKAVYNRLNTDGVVVGTVTGTPQ